MEKSSQSIMMGIYSWLKYAFFSIYLQLMNEENICKLVMSIHNLQTSKKG